MSAITDNISGRHSIERGRFRAVLLPKQVQAKTISGGPSTGKKGILSYQYSAQNHDWDLTLHAAADLIKAGLVADRQPKTGSLSMGFSYFTGGMVLCFAAIESFSASVAFSMQSDARFSSFDFQRYRSTGRFWDKMGMLMSAAAIEIDRGQGLFQHIGQMQVWRNLVTHASPYGIEPTEIDNTVDTPAWPIRSTPESSMKRPLLSSNWSSSRLASTPVRQPPTRFLNNHRCESRHIWRDRYAIYAVPYNSRAASMTSCGAESVRPRR